MMWKKILTLPTNSVSFRRTAFKVISRSLSEQSIDDVEEKWDLLSAVCLERHPVITKPMRDIETKYQQMLHQVELENSITSDFEIKKQKEKKLKKEASEVENISSTQTIEDLEEIWERELAKFKFASRISESKEDNAVVSLKRKLDKNLILLVEQKIGNCSLWIPPQSIRKHNETMIQTASRTLQELCGNNVKVKFYGNAPIGFYKYMYPKKVREKGQDGAKIFYFLAKYISGDISHNIKHCWLDREELKTVVHPDVHKSLSKFLLPD